MSARLSTAIRIGDAAKAILQKTKSFPDQQFEEIENLFRDNPVFQEAILTLSAPNADILKLEDI